MDMDLHIPMRSDDGLYATDLFYEEFNDVNFYFEDQDQDNIYLHIVKKLFLEIRVTKVFPLGGKNNVIRAAEQNSNINNKKHIYVVDRDFDYLLGKNKTINNLYYLDYFCIENHLIDPDALLELAVECSPKENRDALEENLRAAQLIIKVMEDLRPLFSAYLLAQYYQLNIPNTGEPVEKYCIDGSPSKVCQDKILNYNTSLKHALQIRLVPITDNFPVSDPVYQAMQSENAHLCISGKHALKVVFHCMKKTVPMGSMSFDSFCYRLAKNSTLSTMDSFRQSVFNQLQ